ncbi:hypothetical protein Z946_1522 [Sulfitobacter noctilucicola]|uniref:Pilus assembly protein Flp/PilA n=1 Tax=Sulfitobacter noctilucicola TaxID=1342301 RepID=A0A7W6Q2R2_9RHOB|nr:Flp family type IVb pilin [Sulfitobacter noctilucicola]KIN62659.1 hypothetical protein Z946_1522 [Sulfitobacter noctilucicola]MBB4172808.1 pilus assembly protein Flp/PilA [Sulfitobacter noctilucicola]
MTNIITSIQTFARKFKNDESGATAIEYALMAALIGGAIIGTVTLLGEDTNSSYNEIRTTLNGETSSGS